MKTLLASFAITVTILCIPDFATAREADAKPSHLRQVIQMVHTRWLVKDGAPPNVQAMAQTPDGWLWIASSTGLFRFDGNKFARYQPPAGGHLPADILGLGVLSDGTLWISPSVGGLYFLREQALTRFDAKTNALPANHISGVTRDMHGQIWLVSSQGLYRLDAGSQTWRNVSVENGLPAKRGFQGIFTDSRGTVWIKGGAGIYARGRNAFRFERITDSVGMGEKFREAPDGSVWVADGGRGLVRVHPGAGPAHENAPLEMYKGLVGSEFFIDRHGAFWWPQNPAIIRADMKNAGAPLQEYTRQQGLSGQAVMTGMEDQEGNIWVATERGIDQFRAPRVSELQLPAYAANGRPILAGPDGDLWIDHVYLRNSTGAPQAFGPLSDVASLALAFYRDPKGKVWSGGLDGLWQVDGLKRVQIPLPPVLAKSKYKPILSMAMDAEDALWLSCGPLGSWRLKDGVWAAHGGVPGLANFQTTTIVTGADGAVWFGSVSNALAILDKGRLRKLGVSDGLDIGNVLQIIPQGAGAYLGGEDGLAFFDGRRVIRIRGEDDESFPTASGLVLFPDGTLWANTGHGLVSIEAGELQRAVADSAYRVRYQRFDENDGLAGIAPPLAPLPSMVRTSTGELIISTTGSVFRFDPAHHAKNTLRPAVQVTAVSDGRTEQQPSAGMTLAPSPDTVRIDYTALSLALPARVRFRYMLEGVDHSWQDAGTRRSAFYTQLSPGNYTFRVIAANNDGLWNDDGARVGFEVLPTWKQTVWFKLLCAAGLVLAAWGLYRLRLRIVLKRMAMAYEARVTERSRIARDLHDTLLQSVQGLLLVFENIARRTPDGEPIKHVMNDALAMAVRVVEEGRDKVSGLRHETAMGRRLGAALEEYGRDLAAHHRIEFALVEHGAVRALVPAAHEELLAIGCEAIRNAFAHANASHVNVELDYQDRMLRMVVRDDGRGIEVAYQDGRPGHWGITGIRERAAQLGAACELSNAAGCGCVWRFHLPAALAYRNQDVTCTASSDTSTAKALQ